MRWWNRFNVSKAYYSFLPHQKKELGLKLGFKRYLNMFILKANHLSATVSLREYFWTISLYYQTMKSIASIAKSCTLHLLFPQYLLIQKQIWPPIKRPDPWWLKSNQISLEPKLRRNVQKMFRSFTRRLRWLCTIVTSFILRPSNWVRKNFQNPLSSWKTPVSTTTMWSASFESVQPESRSGSRMGADWILCASLYCDRH